MPSIGNLSATITADAQKFISEFARADNEARRRTAEISRSLDKFQGDVKKKFSIGQIGGSVLQGLGLGSGFALAERAAEQVVNFYKEAADTAQKIEDSSKRAMDAVVERLRLMQNPDQQLASTQKARRGVEAILDKDNARLSAAAAITGEGRAAAASRMLALRGALTDAQRGELAAEIETLRTEEKRLQIGIDAQKAAKDETEEAQRLKFIMHDVAKEEEARARSAASGAEFIREQRQEAEALAEAQVRYAERFGPDYSAIKEVSFSAADSFKEQEERGQQMRTAMFEIFDSVGDRASATFAEMVLTGSNAFDSLVDSLARASIEMAARMAVINPIMNAVFGLSGTSILPAMFGRGAPAAEGGFRPAGRPYLVGEKGPEVFMPGVSGTIIPNRALAGGGGVTNHYSIDARGASVDAVAELRQMMRALNSSIEPRSIAAIRDADRRRK